MERAGTIAALFLLPGVAYLVVRYGFWGMGSFQIRPSASLSIDETEVLRFFSSYITTLLSWAAALCGGIVAIYMGTKSKADSGGSPLSRRVRVKSIVATMLCLFSFAFGVIASETLGSMLSAHAVINMAGYNLPQILNAQFLALCAAGATFLHMVFFDV